LNSVTHPARVVSGVRSTGKLHLGHYHGILKNWVKLQHEYECFFFVADWHSLTTHYETPHVIANSAVEMVIDWLAVGIDPRAATIFVQSRVPEHAELHLLLSMITPLSWLERMPTYKDQQQQLKDKDLSNYGFLGYPLLQSADVLAYKANFVPVGEDQIPHIEITREIARHFNHLYGREHDFAEKVAAAIAKLGKKNAKLYRELHKRFQERGEQEALATGQALIESQSQLSLNDHERLSGYLAGNNKIILPEPQALLTSTAKLPGLDGRKMSKSYHNVINLREKPEIIDQKIRTMPTDPARVKRTDPGEPEKCPVWQLHKVYSASDTQEWVVKGCRSAGIGCLECKKPLIQAIQEEQADFIERAKPFAENPDLVHGIIAEGCEKAREVARDTLNEVNEVMGLNYL
jgi:tryptophanyl-tRNA synthetase